VAAMEDARLEMDDGVPAAPDAAESPPDAGAVQREEDVGPSVWHKAERENARRALLQHGLERWHEVCDRMYRDRALSGSALTPTTSPSTTSVEVRFRRRNVDDVRDLAYDFLRAVHATVARKARADARDARDARDLHTLESWARDRLKAASVGPKARDRFVPDPHGVIGEWAKLEKNAVSYARRLKTLDAVNLASERVFLEETRDDAEATLEAAFRNAEMSDSKETGAAEKGAMIFPDAKEQSRERKDRVSRMPVWWDAACDAWLLRGCAAHGAFAPSSWDDVREDAACSAAFRDAAARRGEDVLRRFLKSLEEARERSEANKERGFTRRAGGDVALDRKADPEPNPAAARIAIRGCEDDTDEKTYRAVPRNDALEFDPCAWPSSETLSARVKRLAEVLGAPDATPPPADPPWVAAKLGRPRFRKRVRVREKFAPADLALAAAEATRHERKKRRKAKRAAMRHDAARVVDAMNRLAWTELLAAEGDAPEIATDASGEASLRAARARVSDWTKADLMRLLRGVTAFGLPWRADVPGAPDWEHLARVSEFAQTRSAAQTRAAFHALALETSLILDVTGGKSRRAADTSDHDVKTCRCFVCGSKRRRVEEGGGDENGDFPMFANQSKASSARARGAKPDELNVARKSLDAGDDEKSDKSGSDDAESDEDDAFAIRPAVTDTSEPGPSQKTLARQQLRPFGLLTAVYATRALASLEILQVLRRAAATLVSSRETRDENENENESVAVAVANAWPLPNMKTKDLPEWWDERVHFPALVRGVLKHGLANLDAVAEDPELPFAREKSERSAGDTPGEALPPPRMCLRVLGIAARLYKRTILRDVM